MISKDKLYKSPEYLLTKYQIEIFRQLSSYMKENNFSQKDVAKKLGVSRSYVNQIVKGKFNFTLKKLIELSLAIGKVPTIEFTTIENHLDATSRRHNQSFSTKPTSYRLVGDYVLISSISATGTIEAKDHVLKLADTCSLN